jgi:hypothetical protein
VRHDRSGEFASANQVREEPEPPSNRAGAVRFDPSRWDTKNGCVKRKRPHPLGSRQISGACRNHTANGPSGHRDRASNPALVPLFSSRPGKHSRNLFIPISKLCHSGRRKISRCATTHVERRTPRPSGRAEGRPRFHCSPDEAGPGLHVP